MPRNALNLSPFDRLLVWAVAALGAFGAFFLLFMPRLGLPAEDAVILFQFSRNLALHGAITFIPGGVHAEGATDFLWMVLIALGIKLGIQPFWLVAVINFVCLFLLAALLLKIAARPIRPLPALFLMGCFALMPQFFAAAVGFSSLPFCCLLLLTTLAFLRKNDVALPLLALALCLFRPDGVVFVIPLMVSALIIYPGKARRFLLQLALFVLPGLVYFVSRWRYFHNLLPLPFQVKSNTERIAHFLVAGSLRESKLLLLFALVVLFFVLRGRLGRAVPPQASAQNWAVLLSLVGLPNLFYLAMRLDQNIGLRFFIYLPLGVGILIAMNWSAIAPRLGFYLRVGLATWLLFVFHTSFASGHSEWAQQFDIRTAIARDMGQLPPGRILLTEAGIVPYYSHWSAYDAWGLNTEQFAHHLIQPADVQSLAPDALLLVALEEPNCTPQSDWAAPYTERNWSHMTRNLLTGADPSHYELWFVPFGNTEQRRHMGLANWQGPHECWLLRRDSPERPAMEAILTKHGGLTSAEMTAKDPAFMAEHTTPNNPPATPRGSGSLPSRLWHALD